MFNVDGAKSADYRGKQAKDRMVNVCNKCVDHSLCATESGVKAKNIRLVKESAEDSMVNVHIARCARAPCTK